VEKGKGADLFNLEVQGLRLKSSVGKEDIPRGRGQGLRERASAVKHGERGVGGTMQKEKAVDGE